MENVKVNIGSDYLVKSDISINQYHIPAGTVLWAWFCGQLIMVERIGQCEYATTPARIIGLIKAGKLEEMSA